MKLLNKIMWFYTTLAILDFALTIWGVSTFGVFIEANKIQKWLITHNTHLFVIAFVVHFIPVYLILKRMINHDRLYDKDTLIKKFCAAGLTGLIAIKLFVVILWQVKFITTYIPKNIF